MFRTSTGSAKRTSLAAAGCAAALAMGLSLAAAAPAAATDANGRYTAKEIRTFLNGFYGEHGPSAKDRKHKVSDVLKQRAAENPEVDVLLCAQNQPQSIDIGKVTTAQSARVGWASVTTHWGENGEDTAVFTAYVDLDGKQPLKLLDVDCSAGS